MKIYYYLLFRIYRFYIDILKEEDIPLIFVTSVSTILIYINIYTINVVLGLFNIGPIIDSKFFVISVLIAIWIVNYVFFVKPKNFLEYNFKKNRLGGFFIIVYIILTGVLFILVANHNRAVIL
jgi:hypothetical protein